MPKRRGSHPDSHFQNGVLQQVCEGGLFLIQNQDWLPRSQGSTQYSEGPPCKGHLGDKSEAGQGWGDPKEVRTVQVTAGPKAPLSLMPQVPGQAEASPGLLEAFFKSWIQQ